MKTVSIILPNQLFETLAFVEPGSKVILVEEYLFFGQFAFHKQKLAYHRASMRCYEAYLEKKGFKVEYVSAQEEKSDIRVLLPDLSRQGVTHIKLFDPVDDWLQRRLAKGSQQNNIALEIFDTPQFINQQKELDTFFKPQGKKFFQTKFYIKERKRLQILIENEDKPVGGKWSFDAENRKKYPKAKLPPVIRFPDSNKYYEEAKRYVEEHYASNPGSLDNFPLYPIDYKSAKEWLKSFLETRFLEFGPYEDAIVAEANFLNHSVLTPMLNTGLLTPKVILEACLSYSELNEVPINSMEGFIRQIIGWREFIRGIYQAKGREERTRNFWNFTRKIPDSFYTGTTGIRPIDQTIKKVLSTGYCHHIERLMILGNFMVLCEFDPKEVYRWFMELFIDSYDWVMVPNVYGMSQFADGGLMSTKPYISGSNYILKMSNYKKEGWCEIWDGLFWRFMHVNRSFFLKNPRLGMLVRTLDKMSDEKREAHFNKAEKYLNQISS